tara:strand:+ start:2328 stop:3464 length:1137 start_codon:yes stop_codon:yes gene_type:complete
MKYLTGFPYFPPNDIENIIVEIKEIISGNGLLTKGPKIKLFENNFAKSIESEYAIAVNSCTSALEIALRMVGIKPDEEVIVPVQTFVSSGTSVINAGGNVIFCEVDDNHLIDFDDMKNKITNKTKAVIIVHYLGLIHPEIFEIKKFLKQKGIFLIEDCAHSQGAKVNNVYAGNIGDVGCFSFYSTKITTCGGEGGLISTNNKTFFEIGSSIRSIGIDIKSNTEIFNRIGGNYRMSEIQAIIGIYQLNRLKDFIDHRNKIAKIYKEILYPLKQDKLIDFQNFPSSIDCSYWKFLILLKNNRLNRNYFKKELGKSSIQIDWPYQPLLHLQPVFKKLYGNKKGSLIKSENLAMRSFCLPTHLGILEKDAEFISKKVLEAFH